jgi:hypothetical protein
VYGAAWDAIVPLAGGVPRPLADDVQDADFAPEGSLAGGPSSSGDARRASAGSLAVVRAAGHKFRIELPLVEEPGWITHARVSPDARASRTCGTRMPTTTPAS